MRVPAARFAVRIEVDTTWTVYDIFTGQPAKPTRWQLVGLTRTKAIEYRDLINAKELKQRDRRH